MIPPTRQAQHAMACHRESRGAGYFHTGTDLRLIRGSEANPLKANQPADIGRRRALGAQFAQTGGLGRF
jgi:hypothetical protein